MFLILPVTGGGGGGGGGHMYTLSCPHSLICIKIVNSFTKTELIFVYEHTAVHCMQGFPKPT